MVGQTIADNAGADDDYICFFRYLTHFFLLSLQLLNCMELGADRFFGGLHDGATRVVEDKTEGVLLARMCVPGRYANLPT
jgi:hypothetical protein